MTLYIKNMVCDRCILVVKQELKKLNVESSSVTLGEVQNTGDVPAEKLQQFEKNLADLGFGLLEKS